jgi:hypothetical protein
VKGGKGEKKEERRRVKHSVQPVGRIELIDLLNERFLNLSISCVSDSVCSVMLGMIQYLKKVGKECWSGWVGMWLFPPLSEKTKNPSYLQMIMTISAF